MSNTPDYTHFCEIARQRSGLILGDDKRYLVDGRLQPIAVAEGLGTVDALLAKIRSGASDVLIRRCVEAMATHETSFFRDRTPFDQLVETAIPHLQATMPHRNSLRIWSAACSTGQEPYSLAMTLMQQSSLANWNIEIVATDLTDNALSQARTGRYSAFEIKRGLSEAEIAKYFQRINDETWEVLPQLKKWLRFRTLNLLEPLVGLGTFDIVLCRNVLIYFNRQTKAEVLKKISTVLQPNGLLMLGSAETVVGLSTEFAVLKNARGVYQLAKAAVGAAAK